MSADRGRRARIADTHGLVAAARGWRSVALMVALTLVIAVVAALGVSA